MHFLCTGTFLCQPMRIVYQWFDNQHSHLQPLHTPTNENCLLSAQPSPAITPATKNCIPMIWQLAQPSPAITPTNENCLLSVQPSPAITPTNENCFYSTKFIMCLSIFLSQPIKLVLFFYCIFFLYIFMPTNSTVTVSPMIRLSLLPSPTFAFLLYAGLFWSYQCCHLDFAFPPSAFDQPSMRTVVNLLLTCQ